jgi:hypothetical protein
MIMRTNFKRARIVRQLFHEHGYQIGDLHLGGGGHWRLVAARPGEPPRQWTVQRDYGRRTVHNLHADLRRGFQR